MPPRQRRGLAAGTVIGSIQCFSCAGLIDVRLNGAGMAHDSCPNDHPDNPYMKCGAQYRWGRFDTDRMIDQFEAQQNVRDISEPGSEVRSDPVSEQTAETGRSEPAGEVGTTVGDASEAGSENVGTEPGSDVGPAVRDRDPLWC